MGGVVPAAILGMVLLLLFKLIAISAFMQRLFGPENTILKGAFRYMAFGGIAVFVLMIINIQWPKYLSVFPEYLEATRIMASPARFVLILWIAVSILSVPYLALYRPITVNLMRRMPEKMRKTAAEQLVVVAKIEKMWAKGQLIYNGLLAGVLGLFVYGVIFNSLPNEFGGIGKRCAYLDFHVDQVSGATFEALAAPSAPLAPAASAPANQTAATQPAAPAPTALAGAQPPAKDGSGAPPTDRLAKVVRSRQVDVIFKGSTVIVVKAEGLLYELSPDIVRTVAWCDSPVRSPT